MMRKGLKIIVFIFESLQTTTATLVHRRSFRETSADGVWSDQSAGHKIV